METSVETEIFKSVGDILFIKNEKLRWPSVAWKRLFEIQSAGTTDFSKSDSSSQEVLEETNECFMKDFKIYFNEDDFESIEKYLLEIFTGFYVLEEHFGFDILNSISKDFIRKNKVFSAYQQFKNYNGFNIFEEIKEENYGDDEEYPIEIEGLPSDGETLYLNPYVREVRECLKKHKVELRAQQTNFLKKQLEKQVDGLFTEEHIEQIKQLINDTDARGLEGIIADIKGKMPADIQREVTDEKLFRRCISYADPDQDRQLLKIAGNFRNVVFAQIAVSKVGDKNVKLNYIMEKLDDDQVIAVARYRNELEHNASERKKLHLYNPMHWVQIYRLSRDRKKIDNDLVIATKSFNEQGSALLKSSNVVKLIHDSDRSIFNDLINQKKKEIMQNPVDNSQNFLGATVVAEEQTQRVGIAKQTEIKQQLQQEIDSESVSMQIV